ncbi:hypothetical protein CAPTEDRAFT_218208 [Capitella teleta]|uniref:Ubiquitin-like protease family profile domain-containing protein n=1 Tax=Capitella teleta TaxID=283909 RepID=R7UHG0_CAPTE|nr:hypothetical protein CAPTEDRAFT_218208 [Capitella teleta]|eukprot:ELU05979.1 hypothetical protein CAPTEDRAFT_218208 [Capitella teleta]
MSSRVTKERTTGNPLVSMLLGWKSSAKLIFAVKGVILVMYPKERRSVYIDPFGCSNTALERFKQISRRMMRPHFTSGVDRWGIQTLQHTRQRDGSSCGVLVCKFAQNIIESKPLEVPNIMAARKEIVTMLLDYTDLTMLDEYCTYCCCMEDDGEGVIEWVIIVSCFLL